MKRLHPSGKRIHPSGSAGLLLQIPVLAVFLLLFSYTRAGVIAEPSAKAQEFYQLKVYTLKTGEQEQRIDRFLQTALLPALHRLGIAKVGAFKYIGNDTAQERKIYVLIPFRTLKDFAELDARLDKDAQYKQDGKDYLDAPYNDPPYLRIESILLQAFPGMPVAQAPTTLSGPVADRIYELRSYEASTESLFRNKVQMFNQGDEIGLFQSLGFNAIFYSSVLSGAHMPNLMYMVSFDNLAARESHWKAFGDNPKWKELLASPQYQHNVSHADHIFLHPASYSDL